MLQAIDANPGVARLASNPLLLTILALIKRQGVSLPNRRVELYELYLKTLITAWSKARALDGRQVGPEMDYLQILMVLGPLALWLRAKRAYHERGMGRGEARPRITRSNIVHAEPMPGSPDLLEEFTARLDPSGVHLFEPGEHGANLRESLAGKA